MIHAFTFDGVHIVMDVNSGAVHVVDEPAYDIIRDLGEEPQELVAAWHEPRHGAETVREVLREVADLKERGLLFAPDPLPGGYTPPESGEVKALCLHLAHDCNLRCRYCFAGRGDFGGDRGLMSAGVGRAAVDFLMRASGKRRQVEVDFFGGEPLLNRPVMVELVRYGRDRAREAGKEIKFTLTTNALLLDKEMQRFIGDNELAVVLSIDGRPEVHDRMRPVAGGGGSYRRVMERCAQFVQSPYYGEECYIRGTFTRHNLDFAADVRYLAEAGFNRISVEPVVAGAGTDYALREEDLPAVEAEYHKLTRYLLERHLQGRPVEFFHFNIDLEDGPCLPKRLTGCSAGMEYLAVTPTGELYPCHQLACRPEYLTGTVFDGVVKSTTNIFGQAHIYNKKDCKKCWARFNCSGGCHANALAFNGNLLEPYRPGCRLARKRLECALYLKIRTAPGEIGG